MMTFLNSESKHSLFLIDNHDLIVFLNTKYHSLKKKKGLLVIFIFLFGVDQNSL